MKGMKLWTFECMRCYSNKPGNIENFDRKFVQLLGFDGRSWDTDACILSWQYNPVYKLRG